MSATIKALHNFHKDVFLLKQSEKKKKKKSGIRSFFQFNPHCKGKNGQGGVDIQPSVIMKKKCRSLKQL